MSTEPAFIWASLLMVVPAAATLPGRIVICEFLHSARERARFQSVIPEKFCVPWLAVGETEMLSWLYCILKRINPLR